MIIKEATFAGSSRNITEKPRKLAPEFAFIGRSNVGKSSLINMLCDKKDLAHTSAMPGKTLLINHFLINGSWYLVDLPGYGFAKASKSRQAELKKMIQDFIGQSKELKQLFILIDARHELMEIDRNFISAVMDARVDFAVIFTKCDKLSRSELEKVYGKNRKILDGFGQDIPTFVSSSEKRIGKEEILEFIDTNIKHL